MTRALLLLLAIACAAPADADWATNGRGDVPLDGDGSGWLVRATVNGSVRGTFLLDTGATLCVLAPHLARRLSLGTGGSIQLQTANGRVDAPTAQLRSLDVGGHRARDLKAVVHHAVEPPLDGVIGLNFLNQFSYGIDPRRRILRLR